MFTWPVHHQGAVLHAREFTRGKVAELSVDVHDDGGGTAHNNGAKASAPATAADVGSMPVSASVAAMAGAAGTLVSRSSGLRGAKNDDSTARVFGGDAGKTHNFAEGSFEDAKWCVVVLAVHAFSLHTSHSTCYGRTNAQVRHVPRVHVGHSQTGSAVWRVWLGRAPSLCPARGRASVCQDVKCSAAAQGGD